MGLAIVATVNKPGLSIILIQMSWKYSYSPSSFCPLRITFFPTEIVLPSVLLLFLL